MDQKVFEQQVLTELQGRLPELYFELRDVDKLQSGTYRGLAVSREGSAVTALVNMAPYKARVDSGEDFRGVMDELCERADSALRSTSSIEPVELTDSGKVQNIRRQRGRKCPGILLCAPGNGDQVKNRIALLRVLPPVTREQPQMIPEGGSCRFRPGKQV